MRAASEALNVWIIKEEPSLERIPAWVGLCRVIAFSVAQRRRGLGIRPALGAESDRIAGLVLSDAASTVGVGTDAGLAGAYILSMLLANRLCGVRPVDPISYGGDRALRCRHGCGVLDAHPLGHAGGSRGDVAGYVKP